MRLPTACYRLQFREGMDFDRAAALVPYLDALGASHLYASPLFTAASGSTHGYDVTDPTEIEPGLGGREGLERLSAALRARGMGLVLDIVPNHMAFSAETPWLRDVLRRGRESRYVGHFDLDPAAERIRLPWLTEPFHALAQKDAFSIGEDADGPVLVTGGLRVPLADSPSLERARQGLSPQIVTDLHAEQPWRLVHWRTERDALTHRRFFNVSGLIGVRVEEEGVFEDTHALMFDLVADGIVDGIRIDHIDGLADPAAYLKRLRARLPETPVWVEKILSGDEGLEDWPVQGTTGYVAARALGRFVADPRGRATLDAAYREATGRRAPLEDVLRRAKRQIMTDDLSAELWSLHGMLSEIAAADPVGVEYGPEDLRRAIVELIAAFPRYRTYMTATEISPADAALVRQAAEDAVAINPVPGAIPFLAEALLRGDPACIRLRLRFQQVTGAAIAKSQEDTAFYREVPLLSANEVGGEPDDSPLDAGGFHAAMGRRAREMPHGLTLTSSHDTKRSEDARMRIAAATHAPDAFLAFYAACAREGRGEVSANLQWYLAQTRLAVDAADGDLAARLATHVEKALREAKRDTFWTAPNEEVEEAAQAFAARIAERFADLPADVAPILEAADRLSMVQTALKLTMPGIPDIYQGCEIASYTLTDPDNRRPVDFDLLADALADPGRLPRPIDRAKFRLTNRLLVLRRDLPDLFLHGDYTPSERGGTGCAFMRRHGGTVLSVAADPAGGTPDAGDGEAIWPPPGEDGPVAIALRR